MKTYITRTTNCYSGDILGDCDLFSSAAKKTNSYVAFKRVMNFSCFVYFNKMKILLHIRCVQTHVGTIANSFIIEDISEFFFNETVCKFLFSFEAIMNFILKPKIMELCVFLICLVCHEI